MRSKRLRATVRSALVGSALWVMHMPVSGAEPMTVDAAFSEEATATQAVPQVRWLSDGSALLYDRLAGASERTFMRLDPKTRKQVPALDMARALKSLEAAGVDDVPEVLNWPIAFTDCGNRAVYEFDDDFFVLELPSAAFLRVTETEAREIEPTFSPDGDKLAYVRENEIYVHDLTAGAGWRLTHDGTDTNWNGRLSTNYRLDVLWGHKAYLRWSPDSKAIAYVQSDVSKVPELIWYDIEPFIPRTTSQRYAFAGHEIAVVRVGIVELGSGETTWVSRTGVIDEYISRLEWLVDSQRIAVQIMNRTADRLDLYFADRATGKTRHILRESDDAWINNLDDIHFLKDNERFVLESERSGYNHLYLYSLDGELLNAITRGEWQVRGPAQVVYWFGQGVVAIDEDNEQLYYTSLEQSPQQRHLYRIGLDGKNKRRITVENGYHNVSVSKDARYYVDRFSTLRSPPSLTLHTTDGNVVARLAEPNTGFRDRYDIIYPEFFSIAAEDGFAMPAQISLPRNFDPRKRYPAVIHHYGGPQAPMVIDHWQQNSVTGGIFYNQVLADLGFVVLGFDNRSATAQSKATENTILGQMMGDSELRDLLAAVRWLKSQRHVDPQRVGIWGHSYGAGVTLMAMTETTEFAAGVAIAGVSDHRYYDARFSEFAMKRLQDNRENYDRTSRVRHAKDLHGKLLIIHGLNDMNVRPQNTWAMVHALVKAGKDFDMMIYPKEGHGIDGPEALLHRFRKMTEFWKENL